MFKVVGSCQRSKLYKEQGSGLNDMFKLKFVGGVVMNNEIAKAWGRMSLEMRWGTESQVWMSQGNEC